MLNDMFQRQARRLESQLYQRAQDQRTIELSQQQAQAAMSQVRALEEHHVLQAARLSQSAKSLALLREQMRSISFEHERALATLEAMGADCAQLRAALAAENPRAAEALTLRSASLPSVSELRGKAAELAATLLETERTALQQIGATPTTALAMSSDCNPLHDLSAVADYAARPSDASPRNVGANPPPSA